MSHRLPSYFRTLRLHSGLSQAELAFLIGCKKGSYVSRIERGQRPPTVEAMLAYTILFDKLPRDVVPHLCEELEGCILARTEQLYYDLQGIPTPAIRAKLDALEQILNRHDITRL
ncbi:helix-turn-helix transcriptional regulator [Emcibacter sp. SYSU 3D8]|uniref:helix-turn-helix domain-containing protein n=1 Tax=Emcibacter sp. SYSU 3D8 TaxID=3133969 RepID=UPI0031FE8E9D